MFLPSFGLITNEGTIFILLQLIFLLLLLPPVIYITSGKSPTIFLDANKANGEHQP